MRWLLPFLGVLACPLSMALMGVLMRGRHRGSMGCAGHSEAQAPSGHEEIQRQVATLRSELDGASHRDPKP
jgi:hypothetical protein